MTIASLNPGHINSGRAKKNFGESQLSEMLLLVFQKYLQGNFALDVPKKSVTERASRELNM